MNCLDNWVCAHSARSAALRPMSSRCAGNVTRKCSVSSVRHDSSGAMRCADADVVQIAIAASIDFIPIPILDLIVIIKNCGSRVPSRGTR